MSHRIRLAEPSDSAAIQAIYAPYVQNTVISFELNVPTIEDMRERIEKTLPVFPWLVLETQPGEIAGYAYASKHRERAAYQWSVDVTVYTAPTHHRMGVGRGLYTSLFAILRLQGYCNAYAGITLPNDASVGLHRALGFESIGVYQNVGYKLGKWHDVSWWGLTLQSAQDEPGSPRPLAAVCVHPEWQVALETGAGFMKTTTNLS